MGSAPRGVSIRERPPTELTYLVETPNGGTYTWRLSDPNPLNAPVNATFSTAMPGGFERLSLTLQRDPRLAYPDLANLSKITAYGLGGSTTAWQGRLEHLPDVGGSQAQVTPEASGYQAALEDDKSVREIYVDVELAKWGEPSLARRIENIGNWALFPSSVGLSATDGAGAALLTTLTGAWEQGDALSEAWYDGHGVPIGLVTVHYGWRNITNSESVWDWEVSLSNVATGDGTKRSGNLKETGGVVALEGGNSYTYAILSLFHSGSNGNNGKSFVVEWAPVAVYGTHGLTLHGENTAAEAKGLLGSDVIGHAIGRWAQEIGIGEIEPSGFVIPQLAFLEPTTVAEVIKQANRFELRPWAVWEGPKFWMYRRGARGRKWRARVGPSKLTEAGPQVSRLWNQVTVTFTDVTGIARTVGPKGFPGGTSETEDASLEDLDPENPLNKLGIIRCQALKTGTSTIEGAKAVGRIFLEEQKKLETSGEAQLVGHVTDDRGNVWPAWMVRAGDSISFIDSRFQGYRQVVKTSYAEATRTNSVSLGVPPEELNAVLERLQAVIVNV